ncbi:LamG-like jellyroll fold domain-containing protein [Streptomyces sp. NPDC059398]|uniref:LamG-like jellyroll fold domain-containing protein n=1 Tax=Streptomyces sp. NPDC059398 TaxID=3346820 RepID=UPI0036C83C76
MRRRVALLVLTALALMLTTQQAEAEDLALGAFALPSLTSLSSWFKDPKWGKIPHQQGGSAAHRSHRASAASTRAGKGAGHAPGKGHGELDAYHPYAKAGGSGKRGRYNKSRRTRGFDAHTSKRDARKSSRTATAFDNADGTVSRKVYQSPVNYRDDKGQWQPIDTGVQAGSDHRWHEKKNALAVDFAPKAADSALASVATDNSHSLSYGLTGAAPVAGKADGSRVTYKDVLPHTDLEVAPIATGLKESVVLHSAQAGNHWTFPLKLKGLTPKQADDGSIDLRNSAGKTVERIPSAYAFDSAIDPRSGDPGTTHAVTYELVREQGDYALKVSLDDHWLHDTRRVFPVTVDPTVTDGWTTTYAESGNAGDHSSEQTIKVGSYDSGTHSAVSYVNHWDTAWDASGATVTSATLHLFDTWAATCTAERFDVALVTSAWTPSGVTGYPGPTHGSSIGNATPSVPHACANSAADRSVGDWVSVPLTASAIQGWFNGTTADHGLAVYASTADALHWKQFGSFNDPSLGPYIVVNYTSNTPPQLYEQFPNNNAVVNTTTPELTAWAGGANSTDGSTNKYEFQVYDSANKKVADSGLIATGDWTVPAGKLKWGQTSYWTVQAYDAGLYSTATYTAISVQVPQPVITSGLSQNSSDHGFDASSSNYTTSDTDASISTVGPSLDVERDYNSRDPRWTGGFGAGWSSIFDSRATEQYTGSGAVSSVFVTYPDGSQVGYGKNPDGTFSAGSGRFATFKSVTGGYSLTDKDDTTYAFTQSLGSGGYGLTSVTDADGRTVSLTWAGGHVTQMSSTVSHRALHLTWFTPTGASAAHIQTVVTDPVTATDPATAQTWTYGYTGDQLSTVCSPISTTACTKYGYQSGSQYQNASLDLDPHAMWPLSEASGSTAKDAVLANEGTANATYQNVTLGQPGPLTGGTAKAAGFNGTSSDVVLPNDLGNDTDSGAISLWFKTSAGPGVLYSYASQPISSGDAAGFYTPSIYVGKDGKLNAEFWYSGGINPIVTSASVADGKWHHVVLSAAGNSQSLYLDSAKVGSRSGTVSIQSAVAFGKNQPFNYLGTGFLGGNWPDEPHQSSTSKDGYATYFNGSIADATWYDRPLVAADVSSLYKYGTHTASLLTSVTRPSGKTYQTMAYDPVTTALTQETDENGGVWKLGAPTVTGSSQTYRGAILGSAPATYFRLGETAGATTALDETRGGNGTYSGVTLGATGPFTDQKTASFNGTSSRVQIPDTVTGDKEATAEVWFSTTHGGGILLNAQSSPVGGTVASTAPILWIGSDNKLHGGFYTTGGSVQLSSAGTVTDGKWHHALISATGTAQTLYLDGNQSATKASTAALTNSARSTIYLGTGTTGSGWTGLTGGTTAYFNGSLADAALYRTALTAQDAAAHVEAAKNSTGLLPVETVKVTSPTPATLTYTYDVTNGNRALTETDGLGNRTSFGYDTGGFEHTVTDPNGAMTITGHDVRGNVVSSTTCQDQVAHHCSTDYYSYYPDDTTAQLTTADPRNDLLLTERDGRSSSGTDDTYLTSYTYDTAGDQTKITGPAVAGFPDGRSTSTVYSDGTSAYPAADSGAVPKGLPVKTVSPGGAVNSVSYFKNGDVASTTDAVGLVSTFSYDGLGQVLTKKVVSDTYPAGLTTTFTYDAAGQVVEEDDPQLTDRITGATHAAVSTTVFDADGNVTSQTVADAKGGDKPRTETQTYDAYDHVQTESDANNSAGAANGNTTTYTYDLSGNKTTEVTSSGTETRYTYNDNGDLLTQGVMYTGSPLNPQTPSLLIESSRAYDPAGRLASVTDAMGNTTAYTYTDDGLTATVKRTSADGSSSSVLEADTYDAAGNVLTSTTDNGENVTKYTVDAASRNTSTTTDPTGVDRVSTVSYTPDDEVASESDHDASGYDATTTSTYDAMGNTLSETLYGDASGHPSGWWKLNQPSGTNVTDSSGTGNTAAASGVTWSDSAAHFSGTTGQQISTNAPVLDTTASYTVSAWVNLDSLPTHNAAVVAQTGSANSSFMLMYNTSHNGTPLWDMEQTTKDATGTAFPGAYATAAPKAGSWTHLVGVFDATTGAEQIYVDGALSGTGTNATPWKATGPLTIGQDEYAGASADPLPGGVSNVQVYQRALSSSDVSSLYGKGRTGGTVGSSNEQTTSYTYDKRGLRSSMTDPEHNTTNYSYDEAGNLAVTTAPAVQAEADGTNPVTMHPVTSSGFNTFGESVEEQDPDGNVTTTAYDANGNKVSETLPPYTPPGASEPVADTSAWTYDSDGNQLTQSTPGGRTTRSLYDQLGNVVQVTDADGKNTQASYDTAGDQLTSTDPTGASTQATYDYLGRPLTSTTLERYPSTRTLTTTNSYAVSTGNPYGAHLASTTSPGGVTTSYGYNRAGDATSMTDGAGNTTKYTYDFDDNPQKAILADGTWSETDYNASGQPTYDKQYDANDKLLSQSSQEYDGAGNVIASTDPNGHTSRFTYDGAGTVTQEIQPVDASTSITTSFGYDAAGNRTRFTDGRGNSWRYTYNGRGQQASIVEPTTAQYTSAADSTTAFAYDADGQMTKAVLPGGTSTSMTYDANGDLKTMSGQGADAATATRNFTYDGIGRVKSADTDAAGIAGQADHQDATHEAFGYDDRSDLLSASGSAGTSSFTYNDDSSPLTRTDAAGTTRYGYDTAGRLKTLDDPATGTQLSYTYGQLNEVRQIQYGATGQVRTLGYNSAHELTGDTLRQGATNLSNITYGYDDNGNLKSKKTEGVTGASSNTYTFDWANRLTSWNDGTKNTAYSYDASGNRIRAGADVYTYDARDQLTSDGTHTYSYSARGTMTSQSSVADGTQKFTTDAFGGQITAGTQSFGLDAMGRDITDRESVSGDTRTFRYSGADNTIASDDDSTYTYDPSGGLVGIGSQTGGSGVLALTDQHEDVVGTFTSGASALAGSASYDPLGNTLGLSTVAGHLGFQSGWTQPGSTPDTDSGDVGTASRWYNPETGTFRNKDTIALDPVPNSVSANPFAYVDDNPMAGTDESGNCSWYDVVCGAKKVVHKAKHVVKKVAHKVYHAVKKAVKKVVHAAKHVARKIVHKVRDVYHATVRVVRRVYHYASRKVRRVYHAAVHVVHTAYHKASKVVHRVVHAAKKAVHTVKKAVKKAAHAVKQAARTAYHATVTAAKTAATFVKHHAAAITSFVVSTAVFAGCEAVTAGVGTIGCAAAAGAAGALVTQGFACAQKGGDACSVGAFAGSAAEGGIEGALGGALGKIGGSLLAKAAPKAMKVVGGLFGKGASEAEETAAADATSEATARGEQEAAGSRTEGCGTVHSFTGGTHVLMANGTSKAIAQVKVGDTIANSVPGTSGTEAHKVTAVIVTHTDHDFVDVTVKAAGAAAAKDTPASASTPASGKDSVAKSVARKAVRKAAFGLAASAAVLGALSAHHATEPASTTATVAAVGQVQSAQTSASTAVDEAVADGEHLTTTFHHPFYDKTRAAFVDAEDLNQGDVLQSPTGTAKVTGVRLYHANTTTYDLTIGSLHTYYVLAGATPVLVHNCGGSKLKDGEQHVYRAVKDDELKQLMDTRRFQNPRGIESKYFSSTPEGAALYAKSAHATFPDEGAYTLVRGVIRTEHIPAESRIEHLADGGGGIDAFALWEDSMSTIGRVRILPSMPIP